MSDETHFFPLETFTFCYRSIEFKTRDNNIWLSGTEPYIILHEGGGGGVIDNRKFFQYKLIFYTLLTTLQ